MTSDSAAISAARASGHGKATALVDFQRRRKQNSREQLLAAATTAFCEADYFSVSVEDIAFAAGVSRMTFYRHFNSKAALTAELFRRNAEAAMPRLLEIGRHDFRDRKVVMDWLAKQFAVDSARGRLLTVFNQANADETDFTEKAQSFISDIIAGLGETIPAFATDPEKPADRRRWLEAWLLLYDILNQSNHAARGLGIATNPLVGEILADRFLAFVNAGTSR